MYGSAVGPRTWRKGSFGNRPTRCRSSPPYLWYRRWLLRIASCRPLFLPVFLMFPAILQTNIGISLLTLLHGAESFLRRIPFLSYSRNSLHFMELECSVPHIQMPATCPLLWAISIQSMYPNPTSWRSILILSILGYTCLTKIWCLLPVPFQFTICESSYPSEPYNLKSLK